MLRRIAAITIMVSLLAFAGISNAITIDEAKAQVEKHATDKKLNARDKAEAVKVLGAW